MSTEITLSAYKAAVAARVKDLNTEDLRYADRTRLNRISADLMQVLWDVSRDLYSWWQRQLISLSHTLSGLREFCQKALAEARMRLALRAQS